jgi:FtsH-binding integral membrane protein
MAQYDNRWANAGSVARNTSTVAVDEGLRTYMLRVYNYMAGGIALSGITAYLTYSMAVAQTKAAGGLVLTPFGQALFLSPLKWVVMLAPLAFVMYLSFRVYKMSETAAQISFWAFAAVMGVSLSSIFLVFKLGSITQIFFVTAAAFAALSVYGYTTKKDLTGMGTFLIMGVIGLILASLVNIFLQSSGLSFAVSALGVLIFAGLTAYDTQQIKDNYYAVGGDASVLGKTAIMGALNLYLDFINMFTSMLQLFGDRE